VSNSKDLVDRIRKLIVQEGYTLSDRLPPERQLCQTLGVSRHMLRNAMTELENNGLIWRHVGRGTFVGPRPILNLDDVLFLRDSVTPTQVVTVRLSVEPELARLAALQAKPSDHDQMQTCVDRCRSAPDWRGYEAWDNNLHHAIARAAHNKLYLYFFETLNVVRRSIMWSQSRTTKRPPRNYSSFGQHQDIVTAIVNKDTQGASDTMRLHLQSVYSRVYPDMG
jgi:DNA-binding FadR family transcriptional regulator